jgi:hypothetical protein
MTIDNQALTPIYVTKEINQPFTLYEGEMKFISKLGDQEFVSQGIGVIKFTWFPRIRLKYSFNCDDSNIFNHEESHLLELTKLRISCKAAATYFSLGHTTHISGSLNEPVTILSSQELSYLIFHITNCSWTGRLLLEANGWIVTIDSSESKVLAKLSKSLKEEGGYAITHVAKLERIDNLIFTPEESLDLLDGLRFFLSFSTGIWVAPIFPIGFDSNNKRIWEQWNSPVISAYKGDVSSWFPKQKTQGLSEAFVEFMKLWQDQDWQQPLKLAIHWYVESNLQAGAIDGSIILTQSALELLYHHRIGVFIKDGYKKLERLLTNSKLPINYADIDSDLISELLTLAEKKSISLPKAITEIRNRLTHPEKNKDIHPSSIRIDAWRLSLWYLELTILHLINYRGVYKNRLRFTWEGDYDELPWK